MAESSVEPSSSDEPEWGDRALDTAEDTLVAMETLLATLKTFEDVLRQQEISPASSTEYCDNFCQALMHYAGSRNSVEHGLPLLEVYCLSINCFAAARNHLTPESDSVALVLKRLALSCFELLLSVPENDIPYEAWDQFHHAVQLAHDNLLQYGSTDLQALLQITGEGGAWCNQVLTALFTGQHISPEEVDAYISLEGEGFMEMRVKHLEKMGEVTKAVVLAKACTDCCLISNQATFRQTYVSLLCHLLPSEEAITEISRLDCKDVLEITCNLETEGEENTAFILCTTFLTQQLQQQSLYCSWELTLLWSKLQRRIDPSLESLLERCLQLGAIAKTVDHLLYLVQVIQTEAEDLGLASSLELCVKALQLPKQNDVDTRISVCKTVCSLLPEDLEVLRACQLTVFLLGPCQEVFVCLEELYLRPDQKYDQENGIIPNSLRCELFLALKAYWPFDPEFWDWKTLKYHCITLLGLVPESEGEEEEVGVESLTGVKHDPLQHKQEIVERKHQDLFCNIDDPNDNTDVIKESSDKAESLSEAHKTKKIKFKCRLCKKLVSEKQILFHSRRHEEDHGYTCPVCMASFPSRKELVPHLKQHVHHPLKSVNYEKRKKDLLKQMDEDDCETGEVTIDPSVMHYYQSTHDPDVLQHLVKQTQNLKRVEDDDHVTFDYIYRHFNLQNRDEYPCPGTHCTRIFKHSKYLYIHLKSEHTEDENVKHFLEMRDKRDKCAFCRRTLVSAYHNRKHRRVHNFDKPYTCVVIGCDAQFETSTELVTHKQEHGYQLNYQCELKGCYASFTDLGQVYHHEAQHFRDAAFSCTSPECNRFYLSKKEFIQHLATHNIVFSEDDFQKQRDKKKRLQTSTDMPTSCASSSHSSSSKEPKSVITSVAMCFDGSKFTCGFEKCGMTFSRTRDVLRHLKCAHPEHLKLENKEHKHDKERGSKSKKINAGTELKTEEKAVYDLSNPIPPTDAGKKRKVIPHLGLKEANVLNNAPTDTLREILTGLSKLDLNSSTCHNGPCEPSTSENNASQDSLHQAIMANSPVPLLSKKPLHVGEKRVNTKLEKASEKCRKKHVDLPASAKPYICDFPGCDFKTGLSYSLSRHYKTQHRRAKERVNVSEKRVNTKLEQASENGKRESVELPASPQPYICDFPGCDFKTGLSYSLSRHYKTQHRRAKERVSVDEKGVKTKLEQASQNGHKEHVELPDSKPFVCGFPGCDFKTGWGHNLSRHHKTQHRRAKKQAKEMTSLKSSSFMPFKCQICSKSHRSMSVLKAHYINIHKLNKGAVGVVNNVSVKIEESKAMEPTMHSSPSLVKDRLKVKKREISSWQHNYKIRTSVIERENGKHLVKPSEEGEDEAEVEEGEDEAEEGEDEAEEGEDDAEEGEDEGDGEQANGDDSEQKVENEDGTSYQGRATRRLVSKGNLCYILSKFNKPFHCVVKDCDAAFSNQGGLVRHLQSVHRYNRSQLSLENDLDVHPTSEERKVSAKKRSVLLSDEPQPQYKCHFANCNASYHLKSSLMRHTRDFHCQPPEPLKCKYEGCMRMFINASALKKHHLYSHCGYYESLVLRLQSTHNKSISGCQKKLIVPPASPQKEEPQLDGPESENDAHSEVTCEEDVDEKADAPRSKTRYDDFIYRSHEEALQMCQDRRSTHVYPCMVQGCESVVKYFKSMHRHYATVHRMHLDDFSHNEDKLVLSAEQLEEMIQRKSARSTSTAACSPNGVRKMEYQAEPDQPGGLPTPMSLHSINTDTLVKNNHEPLGFQEEEPSPVERNNVLVGADDVLYGESGTSGHTEEPAATTQSGLIREMRPRRQNSNIPLTPVTVDLSPPSSLRITIDEGSIVPDPPVRQPLKRKNEMSEVQPSNNKDTQPHCPPPRPFDIATYKPIGFESSFLDFIKDKTPKDKEMAQLKMRDSFRSSSVKENNQLGICLKRIRTPLVKPLAVNGDFTSVQNLKSILDKALAECGDHQAIKQLQYLRPVVVLERPAMVVERPMERPVVVLESPAFVLERPVVLLERSVVLLDNRSVCFPSDANSSTLLFGNNLH